MWLLKDNGKVILHCDTVMGLVRSLNDMADSLIAEGYEYVKTIYDTRIFFNPKTYVAKCISYEEVIENETVNTSKENDEK